jgi:hypothetical protein
VSFNLVDFLGPHPWAIRSSSDAKGLALGAVLIVLTALYGVVRGIVVACIAYDKGSGFKIAGVFF